MQAQLLTNEIPADVSGWWVSEKYEGVRALWTGSKLLSRHGKSLNAPKWFTDSLPAGVRLDGELWMGRGTFDKLVGILRSKGGDWGGIVYMVFDLAEKGAFEERYLRLHDVVNYKLPCRVAFHGRLSSREELDQLERDIVAGGGEGCVIRRPGCKYRPGRCGDVIKVKRLVADVDRWQG